MAPCVATASFRRLSDSSPRVTPLHLALVCNVRFRSVANVSDVGGPPLPRAVFVLNRGARRAPQQGSGEDGLSTSPSTITGVPLLVMRLDDRAGGIKVRCHTGQLGHSHERQALDQDVGATSRQPGGRAHRQPRPEVGRWPSRCWASSRSQSTVRDGPGRCPRAPRRPPLGQPCVAGRRPGQDTSCGST